MKGETKCEKHNRTIIYIFNEEDLGKKSSVYCIQGETEFTKEIDSSKVLKRPGHAVEINLAEAKK